VPGALTITGMAAGLPSGQKTIGPVTMIGSSTVGQVNDATLEPGDNTFTLPVGYTFTAVAIFLGTGGVSATVKIRTNLDAADAGLQIAPCGGPNFAAFPLPSGTTSVILHVSATVNNVELSFI
jgi:hypothetical protein